MRRGYLRVAPKITDMNKFKGFFTQHSYRNSYIILGIISLVSYYFVRQMMIDMKAFGYIIASQLTFNIILLYGLEGTLMAYYLRKKNPFIQMAGIIGGFIIVTLVFRFGFNMKTIIG
jgi:hypothetical protein